MATDAVVVRAPLFHTPRNPFVVDGAMEVHADGALLVESGRIAASGDFADVRRVNESAPVRDLRDGYLLPGFIDTHVHFPQMRVLGSLGLSLLDWLERYALPEEARMASPEYAASSAKEFIRALASHGTTTALVFGAHFADATAAMFDAAAEGGVRLMGGMVLSDRMLREDLHQSARRAYDDSKNLIGRYHGRGRLAYAVTPRFALSASEAMLEVCQSLMNEHPGVRFQTHVNENGREIAEVLRLFPWAADYVSVYDRFGLVNDRSVFAHNVHAGQAELERMSQQRAAVAHCPCSNGALGSGIFPMQRHVDAGVRFGLGSDVGGGTGFGILKEGLQAYMVQRLSATGYSLSARHLLYLATRAGADALGLQDETGDFMIGKSADFVWIKPPAGLPLATVVKDAKSAEHVLSAIFTLAGAESIAEVRVGGDLVWELTQ